MNDIQLLLFGVALALFIKVFVAVLIATCDYLEKKYQKGEPD
jgi:hypothetical protein